MTARTIALIPSLRGDLAELRALVDDLRASGTDPYVLPTGRLLEERLAGSDIPFVHLGSNPGFGASIALGAAALDWDWLLVVNDDITVAADELAHVLETQTGRPGESLLYLDPTSPRPFPTLTDVLAQVSLLAPVLRRVRRLRRTPVTPTPATHFGPFSIALISRPLWDALGGFDPHLIYTFEDADFGRRAVTRAAHLAFCPADRTQHKASSTSRRHVDLVLPVAVWSASNYLSKWFVGPRTARSLCLAALLVRCLAVPFAHLDRRTHLTGIRRAARSLVTGQAPSLPPYESN